MLYYVAGTAGSALIREVAFIESFHCTQNAERNSYIAKKETVHFAS